MYLSLTNLFIYFFCRGYVYCRNLECGPGKIAWADGVLLYRPHLFDNDSETTAFALQIDPHTLQVYYKIFFILII